MYRYYEISILNSPLNSLTYRSGMELELYRKVKVFVKGKKQEGVVVKEVQKPPFECIDIIEVSDEKYTKEAISVSKFISKYYLSSLGEALSLFQPYKKRESLEREILKIDIELSKFQTEAMKFIENKDTSLLFGDTGSGKSEIYMKLFEKMINEGKSSLFLLPEIGLTPQMKKRLKNHFGDKVAIWHSKITKKSKLKILQDIDRGLVKIVAGTRSALFLPMQNLGLIVVDEEHDESYKSHKRPRYNARDLALYYGKNYNIKVLLGSATPSLNSFYKVPFYRLKGTYFGGKNRVIYEDINEEISPMLLGLLSKTLELEKQSIIFLPTRANFKYLTCKECGGKAECPYCSVGMSLHLDRNALVCHYCNYTQAIPKSCYRCGCEDIISTRIGTAEVVRILKEKFPDAVIEKFDRDEIKTQKELDKKLKEFNDKKIDILVGTQMLSKGHDYHGISLAVILGIDSILSMSDFRSRERALSLVKQIAGRSGRSDDGLVYLASKNWEFFKYYMDDYERFLKDELKFRKDLYPPFKNLLRVLSASKKDEKAEEIIKRVYEVSCEFSDIEVVGYGKSGISKIANRYRYELLARSDSKKSLINFAHTIKALGVEIDMDPLSFS